MNSYNAHRLGGLSYQLNYYKNLQNRAIQSLEEKSEAINQKELEDTISKAGKKQTFGVVGSALTGVGGPLAAKGGTSIGKNLWARFKNARSLSDNDRYDRDLDKTMNQIEKEQNQGNEEEEAPEEAPEGEPMNENEIADFQDPSFEGKTSTFEPPEESPYEGFNFDEAPETGAEAEDVFADMPKPDMSSFSSATRSEPMFDGMSMDEHIADLNSKIDSGEIVPTDLDAPAPKLNPVARFFSRMIFGKEEEDSAPAEPEYNLDDIGEYETGGDDVGVPIDPETFRPVGETPSISEAPIQAERSPELADMIQAGNEAGDAENLAGDQSLLGEYNERFGTNFENLQDAFEDMKGGARAEVVSAEDVKPTDAEVVGQEGPDIDPSKEYQVSEIEPSEPVDEFPDYGPPPEKPPRVQSLRTSAPAEEAETPVEGVGDTAEDIGQNLARQQYSTSDSTLARLGLNQKAPQEEYQSHQQNLESKMSDIDDDNPQYEDDDFNSSDFQTAEEPTSESDFGDLGEQISSRSNVDDLSAPETGLSDIAEEGGEEAGDIAGEVGADIGVDAGIEGAETAIGTAEAALAPIDAIPGADIASFIVGGVLGIAGIGLSIYQAVESGKNNQKAPEPNQPDLNQIQPQQSIAGHYVGAEADNYYNQQSHFSGF